MPAVPGGGRCLVMHFLEAGGRCGKLKAQVWLDPAVGAQRVGGAAQGTFGSSGDGGRSQKFIGSFYSVAGGGGSYKLPEVGKLGVGAGS